MGGGGSKKGVMAERSNASVLKTEMETPSWVQIPLTLRGVLAQLVEHLICTEKVKGSILLYSRKKSLEAERYMRPTVNR